MKIYFINSRQPKCGVYQYGLRFWEAIRNSPFDTEYFEISTAEEFASLDFSNVDIIFFNWIEGGSTGPFGWFTHSIANMLKLRGIRTASILHTHSCFSTSIDTFVDQNPAESGMPRPLYFFDKSLPKPNNEVVNIGSFGFAGGHKGFSKLVRMVNDQFEAAVINLNISNAFYGDAAGTELTKILNEVKSIPLHPGIQLNLTNDFMDNDDLLNFVHKNDLMVFAYESVTDISSVVDYAISTNTPIAVTSAGAFKHVHTPEIDIDINPLKNILEYNRKTNYTENFRLMWSPENLSRFFQLAISEMSTKSFSQVYQDKFVLKLIGPNGFFLDLGAGWDAGQVNSNTALLEEFGWNGISVDGNPSHTDRRKSKSIRSLVLCEYIPQTTIEQILDANNAPTVIDYVSIDIEPSSLVALKNFPFDKYQFKVLTFEHDLYAAGPDQKDAAYALLTSNGYVRLCDNVRVPEAMGDGLYFEDWWVNPNYFSKEFIENNTFSQKLGNYIVDNIRI